MDAGADERAIRELAATYTDAVNRRDGRGMADVYAPDGTVAFPGQSPICGTASLTQFFTRLIEHEREFVFQMNHSGLVSIDGDKATARWWFSELKKPVSKPYEYVLGVYQDDIVRLGPVWRFQARRADGLFRVEIIEGQPLHSALPFFKTL